VTITDTTFLSMALSNPVNRILLERLPEIGLPQCYLTAGCLFQSFWNIQTDRPVDHGIKDYDVFYFDEDVSWEAEDAVIRRVAAATHDLPVTVEVKNQARVHLWYADHFGSDYPQLHSARAGIDRYLVTCTCIGVDVYSGAMYAPYGLEDMAAGILRMNPLNPKPALFQAKAESYQHRWPWLQIIA
jgi:hypothetical protein